MKLPVGGAGRLLTVLVLGLPPVTACRPPEVCEQLELPRASPSSILLQSNHLKQETSQQETLQQEALQQEALQQATSQPQTLQPQTLQLATLQQMALQQVTHQQETYQEAALQQAALQQVTQQPETLQKETLQPQALQQEAHQRETLQNETLQKATLQQETLQPRTLQQEVLLQESLQQETHQRLESSHKATAKMSSAPMVLVIVTVTLCVLGLGVGLYSVLPVFGKRDLAGPAPVPGSPPKHASPQLPPTPRLTQAALAVRESVASEGHANPLLDQQNGEGAGRHSSTPAPSMLSIGRGPSITTPSIGHTTPRTARGPGSRAQTPQPPQQGPVTGPLLGQASPRMSRGLSITSRAQPQQAPDQAGTFLCPGLVVPAECECLLLVPRLDPQAVSCEVTDSHRVPVFRVAYRHPSKKIADGSKCLVLKSYADDNAVFAFCCLGYNGSLTILDAGGTPFGLIRGSKQGGKKGSFEVETRLGTQIQVSLTDDNELAIVDRRGRTIALTEYVPKNTQKRMVRIGPFVDAGLITLAVLASDLLDSGPFPPPS